MMDFCVVRRIFLVCSVAQLIAIFERQVFDFMGFMWLCIVVNFIHVVCVILGMFGALQHRSCYVSLTVAWNLLWIGWNAFVICLYLDVGVLNREMHILNLGTRTSSWWLTNGPGCVPTYNFSVVDPVTFKPLMIRVEKCLLDYQYIEVVHSGLQALLSMLVVVFGGILVCLYRGKDSSFDEPSKPLPGYTLSLQHSVLDNGEDYSSKKFGPGSRDSLYESGPRTLRSHLSQNDGTLRSGKSGADGSTRRTSTRAARTAGPPNGGIHRPPTTNGVDNVRLSHRHQPLYKTAPLPKQIPDVGFMPVAASRRVTSPPPLPVVARNINLPPMFIPGSDSPYQSRAGTEISF